jgi:hypothetical protein
VTIAGIGIDQPSPQLGLNQGPEAMGSQLHDDLGREPMVDRRAWLAGALTAWIGASCRAGELDPSQVDEDRERRSVEELAANAGLRAFRATRTKHFLGIGDASDRFRALTVQDCEAVAADYLDYYQARGFKVAMPEGRLTVIILADERSLAAFDGKGRLPRSPIGANRHGTNPGRYDRRSNRLVVFDQRSAGLGRAGLWNLRVIAHEATHQLTFNTGLLNRHGDVPKCIAEGLAAYGELRKSTGRTAPGQLNRGSLADMAAAQWTGHWYPVAHLLADDRPFADAPRYAYAEAWLLIDYLMRDRSRLEPFRAYLEAIRPRLDPERRLDDAEHHLGDLDRLDRALRDYTVRLIKTN